MANKKTEVAKRQPTNSERFTQAVMREFQGSVGTIAIDETHKRYIQTYFIAMDNVLKKAEEKRQYTPEHKRDSLEFAWENVNLQKLSLDVVAYANMGLNPLLPNHVNMIPYKNSKTNKFDIGFIEGYSGKELIARRYALDAPDFSVVELVRENDNFKVIKKDANNAYDQYEFDITEPFNRGEIVGGFYYHVYENEPIKNKLVAVTYADILKRKPKYASAEFWGGTKDVWKNGKKEGKEEIEGWHDEMCLKTIKRMCWNDIVVDGNKVDENYKRAKASSAEDVDAQVENEILENAGVETLTMPDPEPKPTEAKQPQKTTEPPKEAPKKEAKKEEVETVKIDKSGQASIL